MTGQGVILGTAAYMSPEQAKGRAADKRSDVWAFGCVVYEMLTGRRLFAGEDVSDTLASVLRDEPDWQALPAAARPLASVLRRLLEKDPARRLRDLGDVKLLMTDAVQHAGSVVNDAARSRRWWIVGAAAVGVVVGVGSAALVLPGAAARRRRHASNASRWRHLRRPLRPNPPAGTSRFLPTDRTSCTRPARRPAISWSCGQSTEWTARQSRAPSEAEIRSFRLTAGRSGTRRSTS